MRRDHYSLYYWQDRSRDIEWSRVRRVDAHQKQIWRLEKLLVSEEVLVVAGLVGLAFTPLAWIVVGPAVLAASYHAVKLVDQSTRVV